MEKPPDDPHVSVDHRTRADVAVVEIVLDRPDKLNALPEESIEGIVSVFESITIDTGEAVVVTGAGEEFSVGADVTELAPDSEGEMAESAALVQRLVESIRSCPLPAVAQVNGCAFGIGFLICMAADVVVAEESAEFGLQEVKLGIPVAGFATTLLPTLVGDRRARDWLFTGRTVSAEEAERAGFVTRSVAVDAIDEAVDNYVIQIGSNSETAIEILKTRMEPVTKIDDGESIRERERRDMRRAFSEGDLRRRIQEFLDR